MGDIKMSSPHALLLPYPAQGHVVPLMGLAHRLVDRGFKVTFVNTEFTHRRVIASASDKGGDYARRLRMVIIPDGLESGEDRTDLGKLTQGLMDVASGHLEALIRANNEGGQEKFTCFIVDWSMGWTLEVAQKVGLPSAVIWPSSPAVLAESLSIPKLIEDGVIEEKSGRLKKEETINLGKGLPVMNSRHLFWTCFSDPKTQEVIYINMVTRSNQALQDAKFFIYNWFDEVEFPTCTYAIPKLLNVGPFCTDHNLEKPLGNFWPEDSTCMSWLDKQPANSVIYVAFGSFTIFSRNQFEELALGLELTGRPFLWVVRPDFTDNSTETYFQGFKDRVQAQGRIVSWCPQRGVLAHPSIACFISHCGWNSTTEGAANGTPFLCWPYFVDQFTNEYQICDVWKTGMRLAPDDSGIISREEIRSQIENLLVDEGFKTRALALKERIRRSVSEGGSSYENLNTFAEAMKQY